MSVDVVHVGIAAEEVRCAVIVAHRPVPAGLDQEVVHVGRPRPACLGEITAAHVARGAPRHVVGIVDLAPEADVVGVVAQRREHALIAHEQARRVVADPAPLAGEPPVSLIELVLDGDLSLLAAARAVGGEGRAGKDCIVVLDPAVDVGVVAALVVAIVRVTVRRVIDEQMRHPIAGQVLELLPAGFDGLQVAEIAVRQPYLDEGEIVGRFEIRVEAAQLPFAAEADHRLSGVGIAVIAAFLRRREARAAQIHDAVTARFRQVLLERIGIAERLEILPQDRHAAARTALDADALQLGLGDDFRLLAVRLFPGARMSRERRRAGDLAGRVLRLDRYPVDRLAARRDRRLDDLEPSHPVLEIRRHLAADGGVIDGPTGSRGSMLPDVLLRLFAPKRSGQEIEIVAHIASFPQCRLDGRGHRFFRQALRRRFASSRP